MKVAAQVVLYTIGASALLVVVNWARKDVLVGLAAACLLLAAVAVVSLRSDTEEKEEPAASSSGRQ